MTPLGRELSAPGGMAALLAARSADLVWHQVEGPRTYARYTTADGELFAWWTRDPREAALVEREVLVRQVVGVEGPLRAPALIAHGDGWRLEPWISADPIRGSAAVKTAVAAAQRLATLDLPPSAPSVAEPRWRAQLRRARVVASPLRTSEYLRAHALYSRSPLERVTSHGDFHPAHLLYRVEDEAIWLIDWDLAAERPAGFDLMQLWIYLDPEDREACFEATVDLLGERNRQALVELRYAVLVRMIAAHFAERHAVVRNKPEGRRLLTLLPEVRPAAVL